MEKVSERDTRCACGSVEFDLLFNHHALLEVDTILISPRHLYRAVFSLHEKSGLASIPFDADKVLAFSKKEADPAIVQPIHQPPIVFLNRSAAKQSEAAQLLQTAFDYAAVREAHQQVHQSPYSSSMSSLSSEEFEQFDEPLPVELFPPCMHNILRGMKDGKKRAMFLLVNFLSSVGWKHDQIQQLLHEWNAKNEEALRETIIQGKLRYQQQLKKAMLPPNCDNEMYYKGIGVCTPDNLCRRIKNPVQYARRRVLMTKRGKGEEKTAKESGVKGKGLGIVNGKKATTPTPN